MKLASNRTYTTARDLNFIARRNNSHLHTHQLAQTRQSTQVYSTHSKNNSNFFNTKHRSYPIPRLPVIDAMVETVKRQKDFPDLSNTAFVGVQHMLETTVTLFDALMELGVKPHNMYFATKPYTNSPAINKEVKKREINLMPTRTPKMPGYYQEAFYESITNMWNYYQKDTKNKKIDRLIILDEGGLCLETIPRDLVFDYPIAGIEQTRAGFYQQLNRRMFPIIDVATSAIKKHIESPYIVKSVLNKVREILKQLNLKQNAVIGIIGNGNIGTNMAKYFLEQGFKVYVYDENEAAFANLPSTDRKFVRVSNPAELIANVHCVFGCTGKDTLENIDVLEIVENDITFVSCSSGDKEFRSPLRNIAQKSVVHIDPLSDIYCRSNHGHNIMFFYGGYPANFQGKKPVVVPSKDIQITRAALFGACIQAITCATGLIADGITINRAARYALDPYLQRYILTKWLAEHPSIEHPKELLENFNIIEWIKNNSGGEFHENSFFYECFSNINLVQTEHTSHFNFTPK